MGDEMDSGGGKGHADHEGHRGRNRRWSLDESCPVQGLVSVEPTSLAWKDKVGRYEVKLTQGLVVSLHA